MRLSLVSSIAAAVFVSTGAALARAPGGRATAAQEHTIAPLPGGASDTTADTTPASTPALAPAPVVVAVAPFAAPERDAVVAYGLAHGLETRLHAASGVSAFSLGQVAAIMADLDLDERQVSSPQAAGQLATELGADLLVTGRLQRQRRGTELQLVFIRGKAMHRRKLQAAAPLELERGLAEATTEALGLSPGALAAGGPEGSEAALTALWRGLWLLARAGGGAESLLVEPPISPPPELAAARAALADADLAEARMGLVIAQAWLATEPVPAVTSRTGAEPTATLARAMAALRQDGVSAVEKILADAITARPGFLLAHALLARLYAEQRRLQEAEQAYRTYATVAPRHPRVLVALGALAAEQRRFEEAVAATERALQLAPESPVIAIELAERYAEAGRVDDAVEQLARAYKARSKDGRIATRLAHAYLLQGKETAAVNTAESALRWLPAAARDDRARAHLTLARAWGRLGQYDVALEQLAAGKKQGLASCAEIETDPRLSRFRADPRYQRLRF